MILHKLIQIFNNYNEDIRISRSADKNFNGIFLRWNPNASTGTLTNWWNIVNTSGGEYRIGVNGQAE